MSCTSIGSYLYTATFENSAFAKQQKGKNLPKLGKSLGQTVKNVREGMEGDEEDEEEEADEE